MAVKIHVLQTFGFVHEGSRRELARGLHTIDDDLAESVRASQMGESLLKAGLLRFVVEEDAPKEEAPKPKRRRGRKPAAEKAPADPPSEE